MRKPCEMWETRKKKERARNNVKINYTHFAIRLFSRTIISSLIARENPFVSCIITASTTRQFETRDIYLVKQHKKYEITLTHVSHLACFSHLTGVSQINCSQLFVSQKYIFWAFFFFFFNENRRKIEKKEKDAIFAFTAKITRNNFF